MALYTEILDRMHQRLCMRSLEKVKRGVLLLRDNALCHQNCSCERRIAGVRLENAQSSPVFS